MTSAKESSNETNSKEWGAQSRQLRKRKTTNISLTSSPLAAPCVLSPKAKSVDNSPEEKPKKLEMGNTVELTQQSSMKGAKASRRSRRGRQPKVIGLAQKRDSPRVASPEKDEELTTEEKKDQCLAESTKRCRKLPTDDTAMTHTDVSAEDDSPASTGISTEEENQEPVRRATRSQTRIRTGAKLVTPRVLRRKK